MTTSLSMAAGSTPLAVSVTFPAPGTTRLTVAGELDLVSGRMLGMELLTVLDTHHPTVIDIDLQDVTFLDCSAIGVLVAVRSAAQRTGCQLWISRPPPRIARVLEAFQLLGTFTGLTVAVGRAPAAPVRPAGVLPEERL